MKNRGMIALVLFLLVLLLAPAQADWNCLGGYFTATSWQVQISENMNLRESASLDSPRITTVPTGTVMPVSAQFNCWLRVDYNERQLWMANLDSHQKVAAASSAARSPVAPAASASRAAAPKGESAWLVRVIDGDTIVVRINGKVERVRYVGVDTPERGEACYGEATSHNYDLTACKLLTLVKDVRERDRYGRLLRYVYAGGTFVNRALVEAGFADAVCYQPDCRYHNEFRRIASSQPNPACGGGPGD